MSDPNTFDQKLLDESERILKAANEKRIILRLLGALAVKSHCHKFAYIHEKSSRRLTDLDLVAYHRQRPEIDKLFKDLGYKSSALATIPGLRRVVFLGEDMHVDVFYDVLEMCHDINFKDRLEADYPTIPLTELLLEKLQIVQISEKDLIDLNMLIREHEIGDGDKETINASRIAELCANDWGFWKTLTTNLKKVSDYAQTFQPLTEEDKKNINEKISSLLDRIEKRPKSMKWKVRARIGESRPWYRVVEERT